MTWKIRFDGGRFGSREIEQAGYYDVAVRYLCAQTHPGHDTIRTFRRRNRQAFEKFFVHVLEVAAESGVLKKVGTISVDGTKVRANAGKYGAVSYGRAQELLAQLENEVAVLSEKADRADLPGTLDLPAEIARREERKARIQEAVTVIEARHRENLKEKQHAYEEELSPNLERVKANGFTVEKVLADTGFHSESAMRTRD